MHEAVLWRVIETSNVCFIFEFHLWLIFISTKYYGWNLIPSALHILELESVGNPILMHPH